MAKEMTGKNWTAIASAIFFILCLVGIFALNLWLFLEFRQLHFTPETKGSHSHTIVEALLITLIIVPILLIIAASVLLFTKGASETYQLPLIAIVFSLLIYSGFQLTIAYFWKNLQVINISSAAYKRFSDAIVFSGYLTLPVVLLIIGIWYYVSDAAPLGKLQGLKRQYNKNECDIYKGVTTINVGDEKYHGQDIENIKKNIDTCDKIDEEIKILKTALMQKYGLFEGGSNPKEKPIPKFGSFEIEE